MAATVLNSPRAVAMSVYIIRAFVKMREEQAANAAILKRLAEIDKTLLTHDAALRDIFQKLRPLLQPPAPAPKPQIGFHVREEPPEYRVQCGAREALPGRILLVREKRVVLDSDLAKIYGVETRALNQAIKRNSDRFPEDFVFGLSREEIRRISQTVTSPGLKYSKQVRVFTEHGTVKPHPRRNLYGPSR